jgi:hypothetical protein
VPGATAATGAASVTLTLPSFVFGLIAVHVQAEQAESGDRDRERLRWLALARPETADFFSDLKGAGDRARLPKPIINANAFAGPRTAVAIEAAITRTNTTKCCV